MRTVQVEPVETDFSRRLSLALITLLMSACGALGVPMRVDGGEGAGGGLDASQVAPGDGGANKTRVDAGLVTGDAGAPRVDAGELPVDAGMATFGSGGFRSTELSLSVTRGDSVIAIAGRVGEVYAVTEADLLRSTGTDPFTVVRLPTQLNEPYLVDVHVMADGSVFVLGRGQLFTCRAGCAGGGAAFTTFSLGGAKTGNGLCGRDSGHVYAVSDDGTNDLRGLLWEYDGSDWALSSSDLGLRSPSDCSVAESGEVVISGLGRIAFYSNGASTVVNPDLYPLTPNQADFQGWTVIETLGTEVWVGGHSLRALHRSINGNWTFINDDVPVAAISALALISPSEVYRGGTHDRNGVALHRFDGLTWVAGPALVRLTHVSSLYSPSPNVLYVGGHDQDADAVIERLTR